MPAAATIHDDVVALDVGALLDPDRLDAVTEYRIAFRVGMTTLTSTADSAAQGDDLGAWSDRYRSAVTSRAAPAARQSKGSR
jgi:hypothetical protein